MTKTKEQVTNENVAVLKDYRTRFIDVMTGLLAERDAGSIVEGEPARAADVTFLFEVVHMVAAFKANPHIPLLTAKLAFVEDDYRERHGKMEMLGEMSKAAQFLGELGPDAKAA